jgi:hypothetical protein
MHEGTVHTYHLLLERSTAAEVGLPRTKSAERENCPCIAARFFDGNAPKNKAIVG